MPRAHETVEVISDCSNYIPHTSVTEVPAGKVRPGMMLWIPNSGSGDTWSIRMDNAHGRGVVFEVHSASQRAGGLVDILAFGATALRLNGLGSDELVKIAMDPHDPQACPTCIERHKEQALRAAQGANVKLDVEIDVHQFQSEITQMYAESEPVRRMYVW